jgi:2-succinyl-6-hydroxy-2,4-cyclohexadiene-1-carboxylate synthase
MRETIVLLHGFTQTGASWDGVLAELGERYRALAPDLRGHGAAAGVRPITFEAVIGDVLAAAPKRFALVGYSMGGRIALHVALAAPERVSRLVLVGATAGIEDAEERAERRRADFALAATIEEEGVDAFAAAWAAQPLFAGQAPDVAAAARADRRRNTPAGLAAALRGVGTGVMEPLWHRLGELPMPVLALAGERDARFRALAERIAHSTPRGAHDVVPAAGHAAHLEAPAEVARRVANCGHIASGNRHSTLRGRGRHRPGR